MMSKKKNDAGRKDSNTQKNSNSQIRTKKYTPRGQNPKIDPNIIVDAFSGEAKFIRRGRRKERSLNSMESREDIRLRDKLFKLWQEGKLDAKVTYKPALESKIDWAAVRAKKRGKRKK